MILIYPDLLGASYITVIITGREIYMKWILLGRSLLVISALVGSSLVGPAFSQVTAPVYQPGPYQPGPFQPVARFNPGKPIQVQLVNQSKLPLEYIVTTLTDFRQLPPGATSTVTIAQFPATLNINPIRDRVGIIYNITSKNNVVTINISKASSEGYRAIDFSAQGGVFPY